MTITEQIQQLVSTLPNGDSSIRTELTTFPSGAVMLDVHARGRLFVLAWSPSWNRFGVDDREDDEVGLDTSFRYGFDDLPAAWAKLLDLLRAAPAPAPHAAQSGKTDN
jgi:hypothetical protein